MNAEEAAKVMAELAENTRLTREVHAAVMGEGEKPGLKGRLDTVERDVGRWNKGLVMVLTLGLPWLGKQILSSLKS